MPTTRSARTDKLEAQSGVVEPHQRGGGAGPEIGPAPPGCAAGPSVAGYQECCCPPPHSHTRANTNALVANNGPEAVAAFAQPLTSR